MIYKVEVELSENEVKALRSCSIERVFNTALQILDDLDAEIHHADGWINAEDLREHKFLTTKLWNIVREATCKI